MRALFTVAVVAASLCSTHVSAQEFLTPAQSNPSVEIASYEFDEMAYDLPFAGTEPASALAEFDLADSKSAAPTPVAEDVRVAPTVSGPQDKELYGEDDIVVRSDRMQRIEQLEIAYHAFNAADIALTLACLNRARCSEANPLYGSDPDPIVVVGTKVGFSLAYHLMLSEMARRDEKLAEIMAFATVVLQGGTVALNLARTF